MKLSTVIAAASVPLFIASSAESAVLGLGWEPVPNDGVADVTWDIYVAFDNVNDAVHAVTAYSGTGPLGTGLEYNTCGALHQHQGFGGGDLAPNSALFAPFPSLEFDTFVTIGALTSSADETVLGPDWPGFGPAGIGGNLDENADCVPDGRQLSWSVPPGSPQSFAGNSVIGGNRVLIARISVNGAPENHFFQARITGIADGEPFEIDTFGATDLLCGGRGCPSIAGPGPVPDNVIDALDFQLLISEWGQGCGSPADITGPKPGVRDGVVDALDYLYLLAAWGYCYG